MVVGVAREYDALAVWILDIVITVAALTIMAFLGLIMLSLRGEGMMGWKGVEGLSSEMLRPSVGLLKLWTNNTRDVKVNMVTDCSVRGGHAGFHPCAFRLQQHLNAKMCGRIVN